MIPKTIHYFWHNDKEMPEDLRQCMATWKRIMPDYEVVKWDATNFDVESNAFVAEAFRTKKWAFVSDYARIHALYTHGGIYLDTDVAVKKRFDEFLTYNFFTSLEYHDWLVRQQNTLSLLNADGSSKQPFTRKPGIGIQSAVIAGVKGHPFFKDCLDYYKDKHFVLENGEYFNKIIAPDIYAMIAETYGFRYKDERQLLRENMLILPSEVFAGKSAEATSNCYAIHYGTGSWRDKPKAGLLERTARAVYRVSGVRRMVHQYRFGRRPW